MIYDVEDACGQNSRNANADLLIIYQDILIYI